MDLNSITKIINTFSSSLNDSFKELEFNVVAFPRMNVFNESFKQHVPSETYKDKSGVYFISNLKGEILYIGKAGKNNLEAEIWGKFGAPVIGDDGVPMFVKSKMAKDAPTKELSELITNGAFYISAIVIEPREMVSLLEVLLQTICLKQDGCLPSLNKQIG